MNTKRMGRLLLVLVLIGGLFGVSAAAQTRGFGFGGSMLMAFFPDLGDVNAFVVDQGLPPFGSVLVGGGGNGRGGIIGGPVFGGAGWGIVATAEREGLEAELVFGGGGFDMGAAIGGDASSVLTLGAVLGAGANVMTLTYGETDSEMEDGEAAPCGLVIEPTILEFGRAVAFVQPYLSMAAQLFPWMGFEFRLGYVLPVLGIDFGEPFDPPAPSLDLSGPTVSFGITFGGIGGAEAQEDAEGPSEPVTLTRGGTFVLSGAEELMIRNDAGEIQITSYVPDEESAPPIVHWEAELTGDERTVSAMQIETALDGLSASFVASGEAEGTYTLRVPIGLDLKVTNGAGRLTVSDHTAGTLILENGAGETMVESVRAAALFVHTGVGAIGLRDVEADRLVIEALVGEVSMALPQTISATLIAKTWLGDVRVERFPGMVGGVRGFLGKRAEITLGAGTGSIEIKVGIGDVDVHIQQP